MSALPPSVSTVSAGYPRHPLRLLAVLLTGGYAWAVTVLRPLIASDRSSLALLSACLALLALLASPFAPSRRWALVLGLDLFLALSIGSWWAAGAPPASYSLGVLGSLGWIAYTLALGSLSAHDLPEAELATLEEEAEGAVTALRLEPRTGPRRLLVVALGAVVVAMVLLLIAAWRVGGGEMSVLAHLFSLSVSLLILQAGSHLAVSFQTVETRLERPTRLGRAILPLALAGLVGALWFFLAR